MSTTLGPQVSFWKEKKSRLWLATGCRILTNHGEDARAASSAYREPDAVWVRRIYMLAAKITRGHNPLTRQIQARGVIYYRDRFVWNNVSIRHTPTTRKAGDDTAKRAGECWDLVFTVACTVSFRQRARSSGMCTESDRERETEGEREKPCCPGLAHHSPRAVCLVSPATLPG